MENKLFLENLPFDFFDGLEADDEGGNGNGATGGPSSRADSAVEAFVGILSPLDIFPMFPEDITRFGLRGASGGPLSPGF